MARQRFIWPTMWTDKAFGTLNSNEKILFVALFSLADDEGRIIGDPMYLKAQAFPYEKWSVKKVEALRDGVVEKMSTVHLYRSTPQNEEVIALLKWADYQKPKYPKPSKLPPPFPERSGSDGGTFPPRVGLGRDGLGSRGSSSESFSKGRNEARGDARDEPPPHTDEDAPEPEANGLGDFESIGQIIDASLGITAP